MSSLSLSEISSWLLIRYCLVLICVLFFFFCPVLRESVVYPAASCHREVRGSCVTHDFYLLLLELLHTRDYQGSFFSPPHALYLPNRAAVYQDRPSLTSCAPVPVCKVEGLDLKNFLSHYFRGNLISLLHSVLNGECAEH